MAANLGVAFVELDIDKTKFEKKQQALIDDVKKLAAGVERSMEQSFNNLGVKTDNIYTLMQNKIVKSYERIAQAANTSASEQYRAQAAAVAKINALKMEIVKDPAFEGLGIRSAKMIAEEMRATFKWYETAKEHAAGNANELLRIEAAKNAKIIALENELGAVRIANNAKDVASAHAAASEKLAIQQKWASDEMAIRGRLRAEGLMQVEAADMNAKRNREMEATKSDAWDENAKRTREQGLMQIQATKDDVERTKAAAEEKIKTANANYATLGIKSAADVKQRIADVQLAATAQQSIVGKSSDDWVRIERAKNTKLKELNKEMTGDHEMSMASMTRALLRFYAAYYVVSSAVRVAADFIMSGIRAIDDMKVSVTAVAAQITTMQGTTGDVAENYRKNVQYAEALIPVLMQIDANSFANLSQIQKMNMAMTNQGVILDVNNQKQIESFTALTNAVALFTQGQDKEKQASQEIRSLMSGQVRAGDMVSMQMDALIRKQGDYKGGLKELVAEGKKHGDTLERMKPYLIGIVAASGDIQKTWMAVGSSLETSWNILQRGLFKDTYKELVESGMEATKWVKQNQDEIIAYIKVAWSFISNIVGAVWGILKGFGPLMKDFGASVITVAYGWGGVFAALRPIGEFLGNSISLTYELVKMLGNATVALIAFATRQKDVAKVAWDEAKTSLTKIEDLSAKNRKILTTDIADAIVKYDNMGKAKARAMGKVDTPKVPGGIDDPLTDSVKDHREALKAKMQADKAFYEEQVKTAEQVAKLSQRAGQDEYTTIRLLYEAKANAMIDYLDIEYSNAEEEVRLEAEKMALAKKAYDANSVLAEKWAAITAIYHKKEKELMGEKAIAIEDANRQTISTMANLYKTLGGYSTDAINAYIADLEEKFKQDKRYASATKDQKVLLEKALAKEIADIRHKSFTEESAKYAQMASSLQSSFTSIGNMYDKNSDEYAKMQEAAKAMIVLQNAVAVANAVSAITAAAAAPFPAGFVAMATMAAAMTNLLGSIGLSFGGDGSSASYIPSYGLNTTVLGGANDQGSESIANSYKILEDTYNLEYRELTGIHKSMKDLNKNITGLVSNLLRTTGSFDGSSSSSSGFLESTYDNLVDTINNSRVLTALTLGLNKLVASSLFGKVLGSVFGGGKETSTQASGISLGPLSIGSLISGGSVNARQFADIMTKTKGGWFSSDSFDWSYLSEPLDGNTSKLFDNVFRDLGRTIVELTKELGADTQKALDYNFSAIKINLQGMDAETISRTISENISNVGDKMVQDLLGTIVGEYQKINEGLLETAVRLATDREAVLNVLRITGQAFVGSTSDILAFSEAIIGIAGDLDALQSAAQTYYDKFFSDAEKQTYLQTQLARSFTDMNKVLPATRAEYRSMLETLDLQTEAGKENYVTMLTLADSADRYYTALGDVLDAQDKLTQALLDQHKSITQWLSDLTRSNLSPAISAQSMTNEYNRMKSVSLSTSATESDTSNYLNYAKEYLTFMRTYGTSGSYQDIFSQVTQDAQLLRDSIDSRIPIENQQLAALLAIEQNTAYLAGLPSHAGGGYASKPSIFGEAGGEWAVPTYEPQRSSFLKRAPQSFWNNLGINAGGGNNGDSGEITVQANFILDGKVVQTVVAKGMKSNSDLIDATRRAVN